MAERELTSESSPLKVADSQIGGPTFRIAPDPEQASRLAATVVAGQIKRTPESVLCFASGSTPTRTYEVLADMAASEEFSTELLSAVKLDEWLGLPLDDSHT
ncbi:MAG: hypothetical protein CL569_18170 [Alphaproteobacteria bacterium]|nr:hypothetical protein [Alphaproteobacteria bacterium]